MSTDTDPMPQPDIEALAMLIAPRLRTEYGSRVSLADIGYELEGEGCLGRHPELKDLSVGDLELLADEIRDLLPTLA